MDVLIYLIPIALLMGFIGLGAFLWSMKNNQFDDLEGAASRILFDDEDDDKYGKYHADDKSSPKNKDNAKNNSSHKNDIENKDKKIETEKYK